MNPPSVDIQPAPPAVTPRRDLFVMLGLLLLGSALRLVWAADMEWKADEIWMYETARNVADGTQPWPWLGMTSSTGLQNPGLSVWVFIALAYVAKTPVEMVRWVQWINILTLWGLFGFFRWRLPESARSPWLWGIVLAAVSPIAILFSRKLWTIDVLPLFSGLLLIAHWYRHRGWGAFAWGLLGALIGQVHLSGFFLATGLWIWTVYSDWRRRTGFGKTWLPWLAGTVLGLLPFVPWVQYYLAGASSSAARSWVGVLVPKYFAHWFTTSLGVNMSYSLGRYFWSDFLSQPVVLGVPTYLMALAHGILAVLGLWGLWRWVRSFRHPGSALISPIAEPLGFYLRAIGLATGLVFTLFALNVPIHYVFVAFPMMYVWLASIWADQRRPWGLILACQVAISVMFLVFIHTTGGFADADYGLVYRLQVPGDL